MIFVSRFSFSLRGSMLILKNGCVTLLNAWPRAPIMLAEQRGRVMLARAVFTWPSAGGHSADGVKG